MKCLNKSLPKVQADLAIVNSEPMLSYIYDEIGSDANSEQIRESYYKLIGSSKQSKSSPETIKKVKEAATKMGISIQDLSAYAKEARLDTTGINGLADLTQGIIAVAEGMEDVAITEEMVHIATAILEQVNPNMVTEMVAKIDRFKIYKEVYEEYKDVYKLPNGKPDIRKIKKEAVDKLIAEVIINDGQNQEQYPELREQVNKTMVATWWQNFLDWIKNSYRKSDISLFEEAAVNILTSSDTVSAIKTEGVYYQLTDTQKAIQEKIQATQNNIKRVENTEKVDPLLSDTEEASNWYEIKGPTGEYTRISKRVTDRVKSWYRRKFGNKVFSKQEEKFNNLKRELGIEGHADFQEIIGRYFDSVTGQKRDKPLSRPTKINLPSQEMYSRLEGYVVELIKEHPDAAFFSEIIIYDEKEKEAGTIDLLIVDKDGKGHIYDWKFMQVHGDDVAWYKQGAYNVQLGRYKEMLRTGYGVKEFGKIRAIPIAMQFSLKEKKDLSTAYLSSIAIGKVNPDSGDDLKLVPISEQSESTGFEEIDSLIAVMNDLLNKISKESTTTDEEREFKLERLNTIRKAIRKIQGTMDVTPLIDTIEVIRKEGEAIINDYEALYKNKKASREDFNNSDLSDFSENLRDYLALADVFSDIHRTVGDLIYKQGSLEAAKTADEKEELKLRLQLRRKLTSEADEIYKSKQKIQKIANDFADKHIGERNLVMGLLKPEAILKGLASTFRGVSDLSMRSLEILSRLVRQAQGQADEEATSKVAKLMSLRDKVMEKGDVKNRLKKLFQYDKKDNFTNKLIDQYKKEFFETLDSFVNIGGDKKWIEANVDMEAYKKEAKEYIDKNIIRIDKNPYPGTVEEVKKQREKAKVELYKQYDIARSDFSGWNNFILKRHPKDIWYSEEYKELQKNPDLFEFYNFIKEVNSDAKISGYITGIVEKTFLPFVRKSVAEKLIFDGKLSVLTDFVSSLEVRADDTGYGSYNEITKELEHSLPKYYTNDFSKKADGTNDYSEVSEDVFKNMILYIKEVERYKSMSEIEGQLKLLKTIEEFKGHLNTSAQGDVILDNGKPQVIPGNAQNTKTLDDFMRAVFYKQKYVLSDSDSDLKIGAGINLLKKMVNKIAKKEVMKVDDGQTVTSMVKTIDAVNRGFQLKTLGLEIVPGIVNLFGINMQVASQSGTYFNASEFAKNETKLLQQAFNSQEERDTFVELINTFMPLSEDPAQLAYNKAGISKLTNVNLGNMLMVFMRKPEQLLEKTMFMTLLDNMMVENGRIVSITEFVKSKYKNRYSSKEEYKKSKILIDKEIAELKKTKSISATKKLVDGKLEIPGLDLTNRIELQRLTDLSRRLSNNASGSLTQNEINRMSMNIWTKSMMVFKGWIPKLTDTRFSEFRKVGDDFSVVVTEDGVQGAKYDIGRIRLLTYVMSGMLKDRKANLLNIMQLNEDGIKKLDEMYEDFADKYEKRTGEKLQMTKEDFIDMVRNNLRNQLRELAALGALVGAAFSLGFFAPDDDEDKATKNAFRYAQRVVDKFVSELSFFYNPLNYEALLSGGMFPAIGLVNDFLKFIDHFFREMTGLDFSDPTESYDDVVKKAMPIKYMAKMFPVSKSVITYLALFSEDFAKEYDITVQKESNRR